MRENTEALSPLGTYVEGMPWNPVEKIIMERRSIRRFKKDPLPDNLIRRILEAARFAPSTGNGQPWKFIVIKSPQLIAEMEKDAVRFSKLIMFFYGYINFRGLRRLISKFFAKFFLIPFMSNEFHPAPFGAIAQAVAGETIYYHNSPVMILILEDVRGVSNPSIDVGVVGEHIVLAAHSLGVGSCWMGFVKWLTFLPKWKRKFGLKYPYKLREGVCLGWPATKCDREVPREVQLVDWFEGGVNDAPRVDRQGA